MSELVVRLGIVEGKDHSLYQELVAAPPLGVRYLTGGPAPFADGQRRRASFAHRMRRNWIVRSALDPIFVKSMPEEGRQPGGLSWLIGSTVAGLAGGSAFKAKQDEHFDVFHSAGSSCIENIPWFVSRNVRWVVDFEFVASLFGYYGNWRRKIYRPRNQAMLTKVLSPRRCTKLMPWTEAARRTVEHTLPSGIIAEKTEVVPLAVRPAPPRPSDIQKHDLVRILFIGSSNYGGEFYSKGGHEVLEAYRILREKLGEQVELVFRCWIPDEFRERSQSIPGLHVVSETLPRDAFDRLFWESDIFFFPSHNTPGMAYLEAMRFGLPIVGRNLWANNELVKDGKHGFLVEPSEKIPYYLPGYVPNWSMDDGPFLPYMKMVDDRVIADFVDRLTRLVESKSLRDRMGVACKKEVEEGYASIGRRNHALKRIYEESMTR